MKKISIFLLALVAGVGITQALAATISRGH